MINPNTNYIVILLLLAIGLGIGIIGLLIGGKNKKDDDYDKV